jgi:DNA-binding NarL/FixJ family response regulator
MHKTPIKIIICDDHFLTGLGIELVLNQSYPQPLNIRKASTGREVLELFKENQPDLLVLDLNLPDISGLDVIRDIRKTTSTSKILVLTGQSEPFLLKQVCELKVNGLLKKSDSGKNLTDALNFIRTHEQDQMFLDPTIKTILGDEETYVPTKREYEVLELMSQGHTSEKISLKLDCSIATIKTYRARIMNKSGSRNSAEMVSWFLQRYGKENFGTST